MNQLLRVTYFLLLMILPGCSVTDNHEAKTNTCSMEWYSLIEKQIVTGDGHGHGPDIGSNEWRSVIEFKLGIREEPNIPSLYTDAWCEYINANYYKY